MSSAKTLRISFVGMQTQDVAIKPNVRVILKSDAEQLDEVVVTAMGIKRDRKALGYAAQDLNSEQLNKAGTTSLAARHGRHIVITSGYGQVHLVLP